MPKQTPNSSIRSQALALGAGFSFVLAIDTLAKHGRCDQAVKRSAYRSTLMLDADSARDIFPDVESLRFGYQQLDQLLQNGLTGDNRRLVDYLIGINRVVKHLLKTPSLQQAIASQLSAIDASACDDDLESDLTALDTLDRELAAVYQSTISDLPYRIHIHGLEGQLKQPAVQQQIRALLLATTRAMVLWRQLGGTLFQLVWNKSDYRSAVALVTH